MVEASDRGDCPVCIIRGHKYTRIAQICTHECLETENGDDAVRRIRAAVVARLGNKRKSFSDGSRMGRGRKKFSISYHGEVFPAPAPEYWDATSIPPSMSEDRLEPSLNFFFSTYGRPTNYKFEYRGFLENVFELHAKAAPKSAVRYSTLAVGTFLLGSWMDRSHDSQLSRGLYGKAVSAMKVQLCSTTACSNDEMLMSILLLQLYENLVGMLKSEKESRAHLNGALAVVKHRGVNNFSSELSHGLLLCVRMQVIDVALQTSQAIPPAVFGWSGVRPGTDQLPRNKLETIRLEIANLQAMVPLRRHPNFLIHSNNMQHIMSRVHTVEQGLASWFANLPLTWHPVRVSTKKDFPESILAAGVYRELCDVYPSISLAETFNRYRYSLLRLKAITLNCLSQQTRSITTLRKQATTLNQIQYLADDICASVPFNLGDRIEPGWLGDKGVCYPCIPGQELPEGQHQMAQAMGGWQLLEPLRDVLMIKVKLREGQKDWIRQQMMRIATIYNFVR